MSEAARYPMDGQLGRVTRVFLLGWSMDDVHDARLPERALKQAVATRGQPQMAGTIFHHDRGGEYTADKFRAACRRLGIIQSASRPGSCLDCDNPLAAVPGGLTDVLIDRVSLR